MAGRRSLRRSWPYGLAAVLAPQVKLAGLALLAAAPLFLVAMAVPRSLFLQSVSITALAIAAISALGAWWFGVRRNSSTVTLWDFAGAFVLIGCAAAMIGEPETILKAIGQTSEP